jgi:hypothetical protein
MFKFILIFFLLLPLVSFAQNRIPKPVICFDLKQLINLLRSEQNNETPIWRGGPNENQNMTVLFLNKQTTAWTIIEYRDQTGCVLGSGELSELVKDIEK